MKIDGVPGTYYAQAFIYDLGKRKLCGCFHSGMKEVIAVHEPLSKVHIDWPVELEDGIAYVPTQEEIGNEN